MIPARPPLSGISFLSSGKRAFVALFCAASLSHAASVLPEKTDAERYRPIWTRSPFTLASATTPESSATWTLGGLVQDGSHPLVFLFNRQTQERMTVTGEPNDKGYSIESIDSQPNLLQSSVLIKTPGDPLTVRFDPAALAASPPTASASPQSAPPMAIRAISGAPSDGQSRRIMPRIVIPNPLPAGSSAPHSP